MRARRWLFNVLDTLWIVLGGAILFIALIGALGVAWFAVASLILLGKHMVFRGNNAPRLPVTFQPVSIPNRHSQRTPAAFSTRRGHRISLLTSEVEPSNSAHTSIRA
jgi:hypothetical protein